MGRGIVHASCYVTVIAFGSGYDFGRSAVDGVVGVAAVGTFGLCCDRSRGS